jgi:hypothetical protein
MAFSSQMKATDRAVMVPNGIGRTRFLNQVGHCGRSRAVFHKHTEMSNDLVVQLGANRAPLVGTLPLLSVGLRFSRQLIADRQIRSGVFDKQVVPGLHFRPLS